MKSSKIIQNQLVNDVVLLKNGRKYGEFFRHFFRLLLELNGVAKGEVTELRRRVGRQPDLEKPRSSLGLMGVPEMGGYPEMDGLEWKKSIQMDENEG